MDQQAAIEQARNLLQMPDATPEQLSAALSELIAAISGMPEAAEPDAMASAGMTEQDMASMKSFKSAIGLDETAPNTELVNFLTDWQKLITAPPASKFNLNLDAAKSMKSNLENARHTAPPVKDDFPKQTVPTDASKSNNGGGKRYSFNISQGRKDLPLMEQLHDLKARKSQNINNGVLGGNAVDTNVRDEIIGALASALVLEKAGIKITPNISYGRTLVKREGTLPTAYHPGSNQVSTSSDVTFDVLELNPVPLAVKLVFPYDLFNAMTPAAEQKVRDSIVKQLQRKIDQVGLYGTGSVTGSNTGAEPMGLFYHPSITQTALGASDGAQFIVQDWQDAIARVENANVEMTKPGFIAAPRTKNNLLAMDDTTGQARGRITRNGREIELDGNPVHATNLVSTTTTVGTSTTTSQIFAGSWEFLELGLGNSIEMKVLDGDYYSERLQVALMAFTYYDFIVHQPAAFQIVTAVTN